MELISKEINNKLNELIGKCFAMNRMLDRGMSLLAVRWKMVNTEAILHEKLAHAFLGADFADKIGAYQVKRSCETIYPATPTGDRDYDKPIDFFNDILKEMMLFQDALYDVYEVTKEEEDYTTKKFVNSLINTLVDYVDIAQLLIDLSENYGSDTLGIALMDANIDKYITL